EKEREICYKPFIDLLIKYYPKVDDRKDINVLVPGCGLARLPWEIFNLGFNCVANEISLYMLFGSNYILNCSDINKPNIIYPFIHDTKNLLSLNDQLYKIKIPDINTVPNINTGRIAMIGGDFM